MSLCLGFHLLAPMLDSEEAHYEEQRVQKGGGLQVLVYIYSNCDDVYSDPEEPGFESLARL